MFHDPHVLIETIDPYPDPRSVRKLREIAESSVRIFLLQNEPVLAQLNALLPEPPTELVELLYQICAMAVVYGASQALDLNAAYCLYTVEAGQTPEDLQQIRNDALEKLRERVGQARREGPPR